MTYDQEYLTMEELKEWFDDLRNEVLKKQGKTIIERNKEKRENEYKKETIC